ncbi:energy-coupling factor transporter ATPase [Salipaludibacillus aurantiacus]|uniref:Energy-coupling factor transport system ATP-binding protein n=1 Tax=Salipaludibacillus aurantiacus TaxID=1601833 RepID=A0A1H9V3U4_9BACI|nr:energy-coupling factor transporter ATPase [Salipaludibacillus aurantiacus]SES16342.1 energy-coupling factor transport system ATP-binding protein [Salipaludibacillus aurantiacus]
MTYDIQVKGLSFRYHEQAPYVLKDISLEVKRGEWLAVLGHNGSGKSTLAKFFNALHVPEEGEVMACGHLTNDPSQHPFIRRQVGMVFQNPDNQLVAPTVEDDVAFGLENAGVPYDEMQKRVYESISRLGLSGLEKQEPHRLSGGQKQRVALAGALALRPRVIVLDEATSMLDPMGRQEVIATVQKLREEENLTIVTITHDVREAVSADRIIVLKEGRIEQDGTPQDILTNESALHQAQLKTPFAVQVAQELRKYHVRLPDNVLTEEELVEALCRLKQTTSHINI